MIQSERATIDQLNKQLTSLSPDQDGFLPKELTQSKLNHIQKSLEQLKDSYTDFDIHKNDLKSEIKVVALSKDKVEHTLAQVQSKFKAQQTVNALFAQPVIDGNKVSSEPIKEGVLLSKVKQVSTKVVGNRTTGDAWFKAINASVKDAESQVKQITLAKSKVNALIKNGKVVKEVSKSSYDKALPDHDYSMTFWYKPKTYKLTIHHKDTQTGQEVGDPVTKWTTHNWYDEWAPLQAYFYRSLCYSDSGWRHIPSTHLIPL